MKSTGYWINGGSFLSPWTWQEALGLYKFKLLSVSIWDTSKFQVIHYNQRSHHTLSFPIPVTSSTLLSIHLTLMVGLGDRNSKINNYNRLPSLFNITIQWLQYMPGGSIHSSCSEYHRCSTLDCVFVSIIDGGIKEPIITNVKPPIQAITSNFIQ